ncbi:hypothetical protein [Sediminibacillus halophilus]|uniref:Uncharacterized protein n=1 Tax=Sediminibacillus halophilus TaxID=482461 RepID=A0A1G9NRR2_9BACI|nr:hypothetical protein [Sediminibacillus halophilus]SDL89070.1 hypothetical protein SAMN05216244_1125 [Sediminibacillus halophilus]
MNQIHKQNTKVIDFRNGDFTESIGHLGIKDDFFIIAGIEVFSPSRTSFGELFLKDDFGLEGPEINGRLVPVVLENLRNIVSNLRAVRFYTGHEHFTIQTPSKEEIQEKIDEVNSQYDCLDSKQVQRWLFENNSEYRRKLASARVCTEQTIQTLYISNLEFPDVKETAADYLQLPDFKDDSLETGTDEDKTYVGLLLCGNNVVWTEKNANKTVVKDKLEHEYRNWWLENKDEEHLCRKVIVPLERVKEDFYIAVHHYVFPGFGGKYQSGRLRFSVCSSFSKGVLAKDDLQKQNKLRNSKQSEYFLLFNRNLDVVYTAGLNERYCQNCREFYYPLPKHSLMEDRLRKYSPFIQQRHISVEVGLFNKNKYLFDDFDCPACREKLKKVYQVFTKPSKPRRYEHESQEDYDIDDYLSMEAKMEAEERSSQHELEWITEQDQTIFDRSPYEED